MNEQKVAAPSEADEQDTTNVVPFRRPRSGGNGTGSGRTGGNWISEHPQGTRFLAKEKRKTGSALEEFIIGAIFPGVVLLARNTGYGPETTWHDSAAFSDIYTLVLTLEVINDDSEHLRQKPVARDESS